MQLNDCIFASLEAQGYTTGTLNDRLYAWLADQTSGVGTLNDLWYEMLTGMGYSGTLNDMQVASWIDMGATIPTWNDAASYFWCEAGGAYGPTVIIRPDTTPVFCEFEPPTTDNCTAAGDYTATDLNFTNPADTWLWTIEPPVVGVNLTNATAKTCTVTTPTADANVEFNLKVVATDSVSTDTANKTRTLIQFHIDTTELPLFIGPNFDDTILAQNVAMTPFDASTRFSGTNITYTLGGTWPAGIVIDSGTGVVSGTPTDPIADYPSLTIVATNTAGAVSSNTFTVTIAAGETAPVFSGTVPAQSMEVGVPFMLDLRPYFSGSAATYSLTTGVLPTGVLLGTDGIMSGTPTVSAETDSLVVTATNGAGSDATNAFSYEVQFAPVFSGPIADQNWTVDVAITSIDLSTYFTGTAPITYTINAGSLPTGVSLTGDTIAGTPTVISNATFTARGTNALGFDDSNVVTWDVAEAPTGPAFWALTPDETTYEMLGVKTGVGDLTTTHTADLYAPDFEGVYREFAANEPVWSGGRVVQNWCSVSEGFTSGWLATRCTPTTGITDPDGGNAAVRIEATDATAVYAMENNTRPNIGGHEVVCSYWLRRVSGTGQVDIYDGGDTPNRVNITAQLSSEWKRFTGGLALPSGAQSVGIVILSTGDIVEMAFCQTEITDGQSNQNPAEYVKNVSGIQNDYATKTFANQNGNTVTDSVVSEAVGTPLSETPYLQYYPAAENDCLYSRDLTNTTAWPIGGNTATTSYNQVGLTGEPNTATLVTDGSASTEDVNQSINDGAAYTNITVKWWVKKDTDQTRFPAMFVPLDVLGNQLIQINTQTGAMAARLGTAVTMEAVDDGDWWLFLFGIANANNNLQSIDIRPADGDVWGSGDAAATGSIIVGNVELHLNKTIAEVRDLGPIFTTTAAVATDRTVYTFDDANHSDTDGAYYIEASYGDNVDIADFSASPPILNMQNNSNSGMLGRNTNALQCFDGVNESSIEMTPFTGTLLKMASTYHASDALKNVNFNDAWGSETTYDGDFTNNLGALGLMYRVNNAIYAMKFREAKRFDVASYTDGKQIIDDLMAEPSYTYLQFTDGDNIQFIDGEYVKIEDK